MFRKWIDSLVSYLLGVDVDSVRSAVTVIEQQIRREQEFIRLYVDQRSAGSKAA